MQCNFSDQDQYVINASNCIDSLQLHDLVLLYQDLQLTKWGAKTREELTAQCRLIVEDERSQPTVW